MPRRALGLLAALVMLLEGAVRGQQTPRRDAVIPTVPIGSGSIAGTVVNDLTNQPVRRATVTVSASDGGLTWAVVTDDRGAFAVMGLPAGRYGVSASRPGYVPLAFGAKQPNHRGSAIALGDGEARAALTLRVLPGAVLTGAVRTAAGEPIEGARVVVLRPGVSYDTGQPMLQVAGGFGFNDSTDDRGVYRVFGLAPGDYYVVVTVGQILRNSPEIRPTTAADVDWAKRQLASQGNAPAPPLPKPARPVDYAPVFYPSAPSQAAATLLTLKEGEERTGIDVVSDLTPTAKISGTIVRADGGPLPAGVLQVSVIAHDTIPGVPFSGFSNTRADRNGHFTSAGLSPGDYTLAVRAAPGGRGGAAASSMFALSTVTVNGEDVDTTLTLQNGVTVSGKLVFNGTTLKPPADLSKIRVTLNAARGGNLPTLGVQGVLADETGAFAIPGVTPGRYQLSAQSTAGWQVAQALVAGHDAADAPIEIGAEDINGAEVIFTDRQTELTGTLLDATGQPAPEYTIVAFPASRAQWVPLSRRIQTTKPASDGHFRFSNLPPGDYLLAAVTDIEQGQWNDPSFLSQLVGASTKITLAEGDKKTQNLKLSGG